LEQFAACEAEVDETSAAVVAVVAAVVVLSLLAVEFELVVTFVAALVVLFEASTSNGRKSSKTRHAISC